MHLLRRLIRRAPVGRSGMTLVEVVAAAAITSMVAGGALLALTTAVRLSQRSTSGVQVGHLLQETVEKFRNRVACDDAWFHPDTCAPLGQAEADRLPSGLPTSITGRTYTVTPVDLDEDGVDDASRVEVTVTWTPPE